MKKKLKIVLSLILVILIVGAVVGIVVSVSKPDSTNQNEVTALTFDPIKLNTSLQNEQSTKTDIVALRIEPATAKLDIPKLILTSDNEEVATATIVGDKANDGVVGVEVKQLHEGNATITAKYNDIIATLDIEVVVLALNVKTMSFTSSEETMYLTDEYPNITNSFNLSFAPLTAEFSKISFSTSNINVAYVSSVDETADDGNLRVYVTAVKEGVATITATFKDVSCTMEITVVDARVSAIYSLHLLYDGSNGSIDGQTIKMNVNDVPDSMASDEYVHTLQLETKILPSYVVNKSVVWTSSDTTVVTVSEDGLITAVGPGTATVTATAGNGISASCVVNSILFAENFTITGYEPFNYSGVGTVCRTFKGDSLQLGVDIQPSNANGNISGKVWRSSDTDIVTISDDGAMTAVGTGIATVYYALPFVHINQLNGGLNVYVVEPFDEVSLDVLSGTGTLWNLNDPAPINYVLLPEGEVRAENHFGIAHPEGTAQISIRAMPSNLSHTYDNGQNRFTYTSSNEDVVRVTKTGVIKTKGIGTAVITVTADNGVSAEVSISTLTYAPPITYELALKKGNTYQLPLHYTCFDCESSSDSIVSVDGNGILTAKSVGMVNILVRLINPLVTSEERTETITVTVSDDPENFADYSWTRIAELSASGEASQRFKVGDEKSVTFTDGRGYRFVIMDFNHDDLSTGGKAGITLGLLGLYAETRQMGDMEYFLDTVIFRRLPEDLRQVIKPVIKPTMAGNRSEEIESKTNKLWLFSEVEIDGTSRAGYCDEGAQYTFWSRILDGTDKNDRICLLNDTATNYWLRSPSTSSADCYGYVGSNGYVYSSGKQENNYGVYFGFCI